MKFTGQVRVPEIDHPGVPATIQVEDDQIEVFLEGESLGRWSLNDVHASRLVSAAFSLALAGEEITFIADEPVDFAYKGVDHMAEVWARYRSMTVPRRVVAVGRSRRGTLPSRIEELRQVMLQNLETAGRGRTRLAPVEVALATAPPAPAPVSVTDRLSRFGTEINTDDLPDDLPEDLRGDEAAPADVVVEPIVADRAPAEMFAPTLEPETTPEPPVSPPAAKLRPGAGLYARRVAAPPPITAAPPPIVASPPPAVAAPPPIAASSPPVVAEPGPKSPGRDPFARPEPDGSGIEEPPVEEPPTLVEVNEPEPAVPSGPPENVLDQAEPDVAASIDHPSPVVPELVKELLSTSSDEGEEEGPRDLVVDLGNYEGSGKVQTPDPGPTEAAPDPAPEASGEEGEKSGLFGAVRSAFTRSKVVHEHEFVEAPGGIGIVRQICAECGYISIGVSD